ncbi:MAG: aldehyde dehydrogenase family protein [Pseudomonadota bacterium]
MKPLLIGGAWVETASARPNVNPSNTAEVIDTYAEAGEAEATRAVAAAREAAHDWARSGIETRHDILRRASEALFARTDEIARLLAREEGKTLAEAKAETTRAARIFAYFAGECLRATGERVASVRPGVEVEIDREPVGVVALITPWNFPIAIPAWKLAPALAYGNTVVLKPAELVPGCAWVLTEILHNAGLPEGVLNLVMGPGQRVGQRLLDDPGIDAISFTGSQATGQRVAEASARHLRPCQLEMGGKNPLVILDDADLETAVHCAAEGAFGSTGQRCTASSRLIVTEGIHTRFIEALVERMRRLRVGDALDAETDMGPVANEAQLRQDIDYIEGARREGGSLRFGGEPLRRTNPGHYLQPALITDTHPEMRINREEVFGPIASVIRVRDYEEALATANASAFGLTAGICTTSLKHARHFRREAQAGMVMVNLPTAGVDYHVPFGGRKASNLGPREQGAEARAFYTAVKTAYIGP